MSTSPLPYQQPDVSGHFGIYGGSFVSETLTHAISELKAAYARYQHDPEFIAEFKYELKHFVGRPSPIYHAARMSREQGGAQIYLKREDLNHTGAHKINNTIGQAMLARRMGKPRIIAETGAGQHGVATATICARYGLECVVYMGSEDVKRQSPNVYRMKLLGATVVPVESGSKTLKDALNEAMRDWVTNVEGTFYIIGTVAGPHPYPMMVRDFNSVVGRELGGAQIYLKREDLNHTGAHKINNCIGQALLARRMGKPRVIAETGAGQHGVATATVAAATPCCPAPVSAMMRFLPMRLASSAWPMVLLILCAPVWLRSSRLSQICAPPIFSDQRRA